MTQQNTPIAHLIEESWHRILNGTAEPGDKVVVVVDALSQKVDRLAAKPNGRKRDAASVTTGAGAAAVIASILRYFGV
jgi:riboflavin synthase alpha subunit